MNEYHKALMSAPSLTPGWCICCGRPYPTRHHVVKRSQGGHDGPQVDLCGHGTTGCHGDAEHQRLHFRYSDGWMYLRTEEPTKYAVALEMEGWRRCVMEEL